MHPYRWWHCLAVVALLLVAPAHAADKDKATQAPKSLAALTRGMTRLPGFVDVYRDPAKGRVLIGVKALDAPFLLVTSLPHGLGSNDVGLDRGQPGDVHMVEFRRVGHRLLLVENNTRYRAVSSNPDEREGAREAFAESVLWAGDILAGGGGKDATLLVDFSSFLASDRHGIATRLKETKQGKYEVDPARSVPLLDDAKSFPDNTELEALLTFKGPGEGQFVRDVAMDPQSLSLRQHISLVRLPGPGFTPRPYHPNSGAFSTGFVDFAQPLGASLEVRYQPRFRLEKTDPGAALSPVKKPIVFYLDPGTPEPMRSALLEGANWWSKAFEDAGFKDAFRVELLPPGADPMDIRYNVIEWVDRATRGWSYGSALTDPRTGEIIKGVVTLGALRVRQDLLIAESLLVPYDKADAAALKQEAERMALARLRQLAAHETGHALGFAHNFAASRHGNGSVMDYPHPLLTVTADGRIDLERAYGVGVGPWDEFLVKHAYGQFPPGQEARALAKLRADIAKAGYDYLSDPDSRTPDDAEPDALLWDFGADSLKTFDLLMRARRIALDHFSIGALPPDRQLGEIEARLVPVYLLHRYQTEAVARLLGGARYAYGLAGDGHPGTMPVPANTQRQALARLIETLGAEQLALPESVLGLMTPPGTEYSRTREYFATRAGPLFDPFAAVEAGAAVTTQFLFDPARLNRLAWQHARDPQQPGVGEVLDAAFRGTWQRDRFDTAAPGAGAVHLAADWTVLDSALAALDGGKLHPQVDAELRDALAQWQDWLQKARGDGSVAANRREAADYLGKYLRDPKSVKLHPLPTVPPGAPI